jgi:hypothetical protein
LDEFIYGPQKEIGRMNGASNIPDKKKRDYDEWNVAQGIADWWRKDL